VNATVRWILIIVGFLVANAIAMGFLVIASSSSQAQVIPDYYARAVRFDETIDEAARSRALGWQVQLAIDDGVAAAKVVDAAGTPLDGAAVKIAAVPRAHAARTTELVLPAQAAGEYRAAYTGMAGLADVTVTVERAGQRFSAHALVEVR